VPSSLLGTLSSPQRPRHSNPGGAKPTERAAIAAERRTAPLLLRTSLDSMSAERGALRLIQALGRCKSLVWAQFTKPGT
jgi:hypothetical protein